MVNACGLDDRSSVSRCDARCSSSHESGVGPQAAGTLAEVAAEPSRVGSEELAVAHHGLAVDEDVPGSAVGAEHEPGERIRDVDEVLARPDDEVGSVPGRERSDVGPAEAPSPALGMLNLCSALTH